MVFIVCSLVPLRGVVWGSVVPQAGLFLSIAFEQIEFLLDDPEVREIFRGAYRIIYEI